ncbi:alpha/beta-hydrolase [Cryphonectria parasitica EP155]|uniref:Alpha/beta-hydrolase n=1 Tax=Cryphonectria parasitica (strain ATCC 38755 / EP155) TaxID=660469 RepID=A0A9P5CWZ8_CRYP1|nr:alpha/beta-hydrolase [Cryphonectria parasitica EP155]KAF3771365.1 alpha/beta-hydrolase [Cryphonectria parasitica EP155]
MGGQQAFHMAVLYPDFVERAVVLCSSARTSSHNWSILHGLETALVSSVDWHDGQYTQTAVKGTTAFWRIFSTWALSSAWFRERRWEGMGYKTLQEYLEEMWSGGQDAHDLLCQLHTWQKGDVSLYGPEKGDLAGALAGIKAKVLVMPGRTDSLFPPQDSEEEVKHLKHGELSVIESVWGHAAGGGDGGNEDTQFIAGEIARWLTK